MPATPSRWSRLRALWRHRLATRLVAGLLGASLTVGLLASVISGQAEEQVLRRQLVRYGRALAQAAALACPDAILTTDGTTLQGYVDELTSNDALVAFAAVYRASDGKALARSSAHDVQPGDALAETASIRVGGEEIGRFVLGMSLQPMRQALNTRLLSLFLQTTLTCVLVALVLLLMVRRLVIAPLARLDDCAQRLGRGGLDAAVPPEGGTEIGRLAATLETMRSNLKSSYESLTAQNLRLHELDRLKSQFLANMSHEVRTPINAILSTAELLQDPDLDDGERDDYLTGLRWNANHLLDLVNTQLDFCKLESGNLILERVPCTPAQVVRDVLTCIRPLAQRKYLSLTLDQDESATRSIATDPTRLRQILFNVLGNAVKFTEQGGIDLAVRVRDEAGTPMLEVRVCDTGVGIPPQFLDRMFEPFTQADGSSTRRHGGTGLGLAIARRLARLLGGDLTARSELGEGTCMTVTIAAPPATAPVAAPAAAQTGTTSFRGRVLLVDDAADNQRLLSAILRKTGAQVDIAGDGQQALDQVAAATADGPGYDLILMDIQMPVMDGLTAVRRLRQQGYARPVVALTANATAEDRRRCLEAGCDEYETKPITRANLMRLLGQHLAAAQDAAV